MLISGRVDDWGELPFLAGAIIIGVIARYWRFFAQWWKGIRGSDWPMTSATIDIVSIAKQVEHGRGGDIVTYLATLTYFYRNPELQTGDYCRQFSIESEAQAWANPYKGRTVMVHVDPRDPSNSVLRKEDL